MSLLLKQFYSFFQLLNSETGINQLAAGLACGLLLGFAPALSLQTFLVIFLVFFFRIQMGAAILSAFFFKLVAFLFDPLADSLGRAVLESQALRPLFVSLYNMPLVPMTRFNNSIVMGSMVISLVLLVPAFFVFRILIEKYRATVLARFQQSKLWHAYKASAFYNWYSKYHQLYG